MTSTEKDKEDIEDGKTVESKKQNANNTGQKKGNAVTTKKSVSGENTGRWTKDEHAAFIEGLNLHGKEWKKIADMIETRTVVQIRTHAQKYFQKIAKTKYEAKGKQPPTDLVSTASNPKRSSSGDRKRSYRSSSSKRSTKLTYHLSTASEPKENNPHNGTNLKQRRGSHTTGKSSLNRRSQPLKPVTNSKKKKKLSASSHSKAILSQKKSLKLNLSEILKEESLEISSNFNDERTGLDDVDSKHKVLRISTDLAKVRQQNEDEDLQWMKSSLNAYSRMPDASPTSVAEFGVYRNFGSCDSDFENSLEETESEVLSIGENSLSDWISNNSDDGTSTIDAGLSPDPNDCEPTNIDGDLGVAEFGLNVDETIAKWINSPMTDDDECTLESFSGLSKRLRLNSGDFVELT